MSLPPALQERVDEVLGVLRTAGEVVFADADGTEHDVSLWFVVGPTRCWLVAGHDGRFFEVASPEVSLDKGWTQDAIRVGRWSAPLRARTRSRAEELLTLFAQQPGEGETVEPDPVAPAHTPVAHAADLPDWVSKEVPEQPDARWLFGWQSAETHASPGLEGRPDRRPLWVLVSDRGIWLAAEGGFHTSIEEVKARGRRGLREQVAVDGRKLTGAVVDRRREDLLGLASTPAEGRWGKRMEQLLQQGDSDRAAALAAEAFGLSRFGSCWRWLSSLAWAADESELALKAALRAPEGPIALAEALDLAPGTTELPQGPFAEVELPEAPPGLPTPETTLGLAATASILRGDIEAGLEAWERVPGPQATSARAAVEGTGAAWALAARAWRKRDAKRAAEELERALELESVPAWLYLAGAWAHADGRSAEPYWRRAFPAPPPAELEQPEATWRALARTAEGEAVEPLVAARIALGEPDGLWDAAVTLRDTLERPEEALALFTDLLEQELSRDRWTVLAATAALHKQLDSIEDAEVVLRSLVANDFLVAEALDEALALGEGMVDDTELARWRHLRAQLDGSTTRGIEPVVLDRVALDGLHPGGVGWLERTRHKIDVADPPERGSLVRGLEVVSEASWPELSAAVEALSKRLDLTPPPLYLFRGEGAWGLSAWPTAPPLLLVGHHHLRPDHLQYLGPDALAFSLAVELAHLAAEHPLLAFDGGIVGTSRSVYEAFGAYAGAAETVVDVVTLLPGIDQIAKIQTLVRLSRRVFTASSVLDKATGAAEKSMGWFKGESEQTVGRRFEGAALQFRLQADRAAFLVTGDLAAAIDAMLAAHPETTGLREVFASHGVLPVLETDHLDLKVRIASLLGFVATLE